MKRAFHLFILFLILAVPAVSQNQRIVKNEAFSRGEKLMFRVYYNSFVTGNVTAGTAKLEITDDERKFDGRSTYHVVGIGTSAKLFNWFFKVNDRFETFFDEESLVPYLFIRRTREGGYKKDDDVIFHQRKNLVQSRNAVKRTPHYVQDILSAYYYARTIDASRIHIGENIPINFFLDDSVYTSVIQYAGRENVKTSLGSIRCLKFKPMVATGNTFSNPYPMTLWVSDDKNHIPIMAQSAVIVGSVKMELIQFSGLSNPFSSKIK